MSKTKEEPRFRDILADIRTTLVDLAKVYSTGTKGTKDTKEPCEYCSIEDLCLQNFCPRCGRDLRRP